ncbi:MAG: glycosyltransferase family 4 protein [Alphaproteobacteria bacterium]
MASDGPLQSATPASAGAATATNPGAPAGAGDGSADGRAGRARPVLLFVVTEDWYFWSHRLPQARAARAAGFDVAVACRVDAHRARIEAAGVRVLPLAIRRRGINPWFEARTLMALLRLYRRERPAIVHHVAMKPVIYGSVAARLAGVATVVNALAGLGYGFSSTSLKARLIRPLLRRALRFALRGPLHRVIVQNGDDRAFLTVHGLAPAQAIVLIGGSGVDTDHFQPSPEPPPPVIFALVGRMLRDKGIMEFAAAARLVRAEGVAARFWLVGDVDDGNPASLQAATLRGWQEEGILDWRGSVSDIAALWREAHVAVLPSYREGLPKTLLEAAAAGRPLIASDVPGCREIAVADDTALTVPPRDARALALAMIRMAGDAPLRRRLGLAARQRVLDRFSDRHVEDATAGLYRALMP